MELGVESTFRPYNSPFDYSRSTDSSAMSSYCNGVGDRTGPSSSGSRLFQLSPDMLSSIWTAESKDGSTASEAGNSGKMDGTSVKDASSPPAAAGDNNEEKPTAFPTATATITNYTNTGTGRESSSPLSGSTGTTSSSSASSSLEISALELGSSLFADSVWSSKGSFNDVGSFGSSEEEKRFLAEGAKAYLKPPASAPGSAAWGSFWSDLSPSLSPSNSETNLHHFGSPALANPFSTWNNSPATTATVNRRSAPPNSSPFSSGSVSPISRKHLSPGMGPSMNGIGNQSTVTVNHHNHHYRPGVFNNHPALNLQNNNAGFAGHSQQRQYRRSASHPANHLHNHQQHNNHVPTAVGGPYNLNDNLGASFYDGQNVTDFSNGWNMESVNGYHQDPHRSYNPHSTGNTLNGLDSMKYSLEPHLMDIMRSASGWDDSSSGKGRQQFFGTYQSYDASRFSDILDPFDQMVPSSMSPLSSRMSPRNHSTGSDFGGDAMHVYSRKVFVGGLPPDIDEEEITASFRRFGPLIVDWPHKAESKSYFPPKGYAFLLFQDETSVHGLLDASIQEGDKLYFYVSSPTSKDKPVQIRPWRLNDNECYLDTQSKLDPRLTVFVGGVPRPLKAPELALLMNQRFGYVAYAGIDVDSELKYPKGAGRITFSNQQSYIAAINARFVQLQNGEIDKRVELKPYVLDDQICDYCHGMKCSGRSAPLFCSQVGCLAYLCEHCWGPYHSSPGKDHHKPVTKESSVDRSRPAAMRW